MRVVYSTRYHVDIGRHVFPTEKYDLVRRQLLQQGRPPSEGRLGPLCFELVEPEAASWEQLAMVHTAEYLGKMRTGTLSEADLAQLELPWSALMVDAFRTMVGGTIDAAQFACGLSRAVPAPGPTVAVHLGGGLHHAFPNHGEGF